MESAVYSSLYGHSQSPYSCFVGTSRQEKKLHCKIHFNGLPSRRPGSGPRAPRCTRHENVPPSHAEKRGPSCFIFYYSCPQFRVFGADRTFPNSTDGPTRKTKRQISKLPLGPFKVFFACHPNSVDDPGPIIQTQASDPDTFTVTLQVVI